MYIIDLAGNILDTLCIDGTKERCGEFGINDWRTTGFVSAYSKDGKTGIEFLKRIYYRSTVYLDRKKQKYNEYCRLYEESYR